MNLRALSLIIDELARQYFNETGQAQPDPDAAWAGLLESERTFWRGFALEVLVEQAGVQW